MIPLPVWKFIQLFTVNCRNICKMCSYIKLLTSDLKWFSKALSKAEVNFAVYLFVETVCQKAASYEKSSSL